MAISNFVPELWEAAVQEPFEKALVYAQSPVVNTDYEGEIKQQGDTVHVTTIGAPTINTYDKTVDLTEEDLDDDGDELVINQGDYFNFRVNDIDKVQAAGDFQSPALRAAGIGLRDKVDRFVGGLFYAGALAANKLGSLEVADSDPRYVGAGQISAYQVLVKLREKLDKQSVPLEGRYVVVPSEFISALLMDKRYTDLSASGSTEGLLQGQVGRATGFQVLVSNNVPVVAGAGADAGDFVIGAGVASAISFANQINQTEALRSQKRFADVVRGLNIYGAKVFRPEGIATATVSVVPGTGSAPTGD